MRRLTARLRNEHGASAVMVALLLVPLIGFLAIALDVGALYAERAQLQNGADAAALAIAQDCASGSCGVPAVEANSFADANANDGAANVDSVSFVTGNSVTVRTSTVDTVTGEPALTHPFAALISPDGTSSTTVHAEATAEWGSPSASATTLPIAISDCEFRPALDETLQLIRYDQALTCPGRDIPGGFGWLERMPGECGAFVDSEDSRVESEPGNSYPGVCDATMSTMKGRTVLVPIFDGASTKSGPASWYHIRAFAAFTITGWKLSGGNRFPTVSTDPAAPPCVGNCRGIQGFFTRWVSLDAAGAELGGPDLGVTITRLTID